MQKTISDSEAESNFGKVLDGVVQNGDEITIERQGKPVARIVPVQENKQRQVAADKLRAMAEQANMSPEEAEELAEEAVAWVRANKDS